MAAQSGKAIVVQFKDDATPTPAFQTVAGLRSRSIQFNQETVDITNASSTDNWRELLAGVAVRSVSISGDGVFTDDVGMAEVKDAFFEHEFREANILIPDFGTFAGTFQVSSLELGGDHNREVTFSMTLDSSGAVTFTAA